jgi:methionyl-tRNA formyltransferase
MKIGFVTCVQIGLSCMEAIYEAGGEITLAITLNDDQANAKSGRVYIDSFCNTRNINLHKSSHVNNQDVVDIINANDIDWLFIIGWSQIASKDVLNSVNLGVLGAHPTLLPIGRGRAAIPWAILKEENETGVTLFKMDEGVDTGLIAGQVKIPLRADINATELYRLVDLAHIDLVRDVIPKILSNSLSLTKQDESQATYWPGRKPEDGEIELSGSVYDAEKLIRATTRPYPGAFCFKDGKKHIVWSAQIIDHPVQNTIGFKDGFLEMLDFEVCDQ